MKQLNTLLIFLFCIIATQLFSQVRYLDEMFSAVNVETDVVYGTNISIFSMGAQDLTLDVYTPADDDETDRPAVIVLHTGSFLPQYFNGQATGGKNDSTVVEICTRLAKLGYVAVAATYRQGWAPLSNDPDVRIGTFLQAAYRGIIDVRTAVRFLRKEEAENNDPYGIDSDKIVAWGIGTGGYLSYGAGFLDTYEEIVIAKFIHTVTLEPYVDTLVLGNIYGTNQTMQNMPNHVGYSSDVQMVVNMGGALADIGWIDGDASVAPEPTAVGFHVPTDPFAPFSNGPAFGPNIMEPVVIVSGTRTAIARINELGSNDPLDPILEINNILNQNVQALSSVPFQIPGQEATTLAVKHMYPFLTPGFVIGSGPWEWWNKTQLDTEVAAINAATGADLDADELHMYGLAANPDMSPEKGRAYIDTTMAYYIPRACATFGFADCLNALGLEVGVEDLIDANMVGLTVAPNPARERVFIQSAADFRIKDIRVFDTQGLMVRTHFNVNDNSFELERNELPAGMYFVRLAFDEGVVVQKILFK